MGEGCDWSWRDASCASRCELCCWSRGELRCRARGRSSPSPSSRCAGNNGSLRARDVRLRCCVASAFLFFLRSTRRDEGAPPTPRHTWPTPYPPPGHCPRPFALLSPLQALRNGALAPSIVG